MEILEAEMELEMELIVSGAHEKNENMQRATPLHMIEEDALNIYDMFMFQDNKRNNMQVLIDKFDQYFSPQKNKTYQWLFNTFSQNGQPFDSCISDSFWN